MTIVTGYGETYEEALEDAKRQIHGGPDLVEVARGALYLAKSLAYLVFYTATRPIAGLIVILGAAILMAAISSLLLSFVQGGTLGLFSILAGLTVSLGAAFGIIWLLAGVGLSVGQIVGAIELREAQCLYWLLKRSPLLGRAVHMILYGVAVLQSFTLLFSVFGTLGLSTTGGVPVLGMLTGGAGAAYAVYLRYCRHPFARHFTITGRLKAA